MSKMSFFLPSFFTLENSYFFLELCHYTLKVSNYLNHRESENTDHVNVDSVEGSSNKYCQTPNKFFTGYEFLLLSRTKGHQSLSFIY